MHNIYIGKTKKGGSDGGGLTGNLSFYNDDDDNSSHGEQVWSDRQSTTSSPGVSSVLRDLV